MRSHSSARVPIHSTCLASPPRVLRCLAVWMLVTLSPALVSAQVAGGSGDGRVRVLSYNVHGLFRSIAKDQPRDRMPTIAWLANHYDVVLFQEDFEYHAVIRDQMNGSIGVQGNGMGWDLRRVGAKHYARRLLVAQKQSS